MITTREVSLCSHMFYIHVDGLSNGLVFKAQISLCNEWETNKKNQQRKYFIKWVLLSS